MHLQQGTRTCAAGLCPDILRDLGGVSAAANGNVVVFAKLSDSRAGFLRFEEAYAWIEEIMESVLLFDFMWTFFVAFALIGRR